MSKVLIETAGTEFEQNGTDLAMIDNSFRAGKPTMINSADLDEAFDNASQAVKDKISFDVNGQTKTVTPTTSKQVIEPDEGKNALTKVTVNAVTAAIDANIVAGNIKKDVTILGVTGTHEGGEQLKELVANTKYAVVYTTHDVITDSTFKTYCSDILAELDGGSGTKTITSLLSDENGDAAIGASFAVGSDAVAIKYTVGNTEIASFELFTDSSSQGLFPSRTGIGAVGFYGGDNDGDPTGLTITSSSSDAKYRYVALKLLRAYDSDIKAS